MAGSQSLREGYLFKALSLFVALVTICPGNVLAATKDTLPPGALKTTAFSLTTSASQTESDTSSTPTTDTSTTTTDTSTDFLQQQTAISPVSSTQTQTSTTTKLEEYRSALLAKVDGEMNTANAKLTELNKVLADAKIWLDQQVQTLKNDIAVSVEALRGTMASLEEMSARAEVSNATKQAIRDYLDRMSTYLDPPPDGTLSGLEKDTQLYIDGLTSNTLSPIQAEIQSWTKYLSDLTNYRIKVVNAKKLSELRTLSDQFPVRIQFPFPLPSALMLPTATLERYRQEGEALLAKAEEETKRAELLTKVDSEIEAAKSNLDALEIKLIETTAQIEEAKTALLAEVDKGVASLKEVMASLEAVISQEGVTDRTRAAIKDFLVSANGYLSNGIEPHVQTYLRQLEFGLSEINQMIEIEEKYIADLMAYRLQVDAAGTLEELNMLADHFPVRGPLVLPMIALINSPVDTLLMYQRNGETLLAKAKKEISVFQFEIKIRKDLMTTFGFTETELQGLIAQGLIKIDSNFQTLQATVTLGPSLEYMHRQDVSLLDNLGDPLGTQALPLLINYQFVNTPDGLHLSAASYEMPGRGYALVYNDQNQLVEVTIANHQGVKIKVITYQYETGEMPISARIEYPAPTISGTGSVAVRELKFVTLSDGRVYIQNILDSDSSGNVLAETILQYTDIDQIVELQEIMRLDGDGKLLSKSGRVFLAGTSVPPQYFAGTHRADGEMLQGQIPTLEAYLLRSANFEEESGPAQAERIELEFYDENLDVMTEREFLIHLPPTYNAEEPMPLVLNFHGGSGSSLQQMGSSGMNANADANGYIVVYPEGLVNFWNAEMEMGSSKAEQMNVDDVGFINALLDYLEANYAIDSSQIYVTGLSNGGQMSVRLAEELNDRIAAVAVVSSGLGKPEDYQPADGLPMIVFHGTSDPLLPYAGGLNNDGIYIMPAEETVQHYVSLNGAAETSNPFVPYEGYVPNEEIELFYYEGGNYGDDVAFVKVNGGGHTWPGSPQPGGTMGNVTQAIDANQAMWKFFESHPLHVGTEIVAEMEYGYGRVLIEKTVDENGQETLRALIQMPNASGELETVEEYEIVGFTPPTMEGDYTVLAFTTTDGRSIRALHDSKADPNIRGLLQITWDQDLDEGGTFHNLDRYVFVERDGHYVLQHNRRDTTGPNGSYQIIYYFRDEGGNLTSTRTERWVGNKPRSKKVEIVETITAEGSAYHVKLMDLNTGAVEFESDLTDVEIHKLGNDQSDIVSQISGKNTDGNLVEIIIHDDTGTVEVILSSVKPVATNKNYGFIKKPSGTPPYSSGVSYNLIDLRTGETVAYFTKFENYTTWYGETGTYTGITEPDVSNASPVIAMQIVRNESEYHGPHEYTFLSLYSLEPRASQGKTVNLDKLLGGDDSVVITVDPAQSGFVGNTNIIKLQYTVNAGENQVAYVNAETGELVVPLTDITTTVYVTADSVAESRATLDEFMALLSERGITQFSRAEIEAMIPKDVDPSPYWGVEFSGEFLLSQQGDQVAIAVSGQLHYISCGNNPVCTTDQFIPSTTVLYKPLPTTDPIVLQFEERLGGLKMGFTSDGLLALLPEIIGGEVYDEQGNIKIYFSSLQLGGEIMQ